VIIVRSWSHDDADPQWDAPGHLRAGRGAQEAPQTQPSHAGRAHAPQKIEEQSSSADSSRQKEGKNGSIGTRVVKDGTREPSVGTRKPRFVGEDDASGVGESGTESQARATLQRRRS